MKKFLLIFVLLCAVLLLFPPIVGAATEVLPEEVAAEENVLAGAYAAVIAFLTSETFTKIWSALCALYILVSPMIRKALRAKEVVQTAGLQLRYNRKKTEAANYKALAASYEASNQVMQAKLDAMLEAQRIAYSGSNLKLDYKERVDGLLAGAQSLKAEALVLPELEDLEAVDEAETPVPPAEQTPVSTPAQGW
jgi:hypothetical protein